MESLASITRCWFPKDSASSLVWRFTDKSALLYLHRPRDLGAAILQDQSAAESGGTQAMSAAAASSA